MLKINSYHVCFFVLFFTNSNALYSSSRQQENFLLPPEVNSTNTTNSRFTIPNPSLIPPLVRTNISHLYDAQQEVPSEAGYPAQPEQGSLSSTYQDFESYVSVCSPFPMSNVMPQPYNQSFDSLTNTFTPPFMSSSWDDNNSMSTFTDFNNIDTLPFIPHDSRNFNNAFSNGNSSTSLLINYDSISNAMDNSATINHNLLPPAEPQMHLREVAHTNQDRDHVLPKNNKKKKPTKTYTCSTCNKTLANRSSFNYHVKTHDPNRAKPYQCNICPKSFAKNSTLKNHIRTHTGEKPFKCDFCNKRFTRKYDRTVHHRIHTGEKPFKCDFCSNGFKTSHEKMVHHRTHTKEKPFKCDFCQKKFKTNQTLKEHRNKHLGEKPYKCTQCSKAYATNGGLKGHIRIKHTKNKKKKNRHFSINS